MTESMNFWNFAAITVAILYNLSILAGTAYLVEERGWSGWWFLFAIIILVNKVGNYANVVGTQNA